MTCREKILSEDYQDFITYSLRPGEGTQESDNDQYCAIPVTDRIWSVYYNRALLPELSFADYNYRYVTELYGLMDLFVPEAAGRGFDPQPLLHSGILTVQREPLYLTGRNVILGFADTGIDYRNPVFRRSDGSSRILAIWDQTDQSGEPPEGFVYGSEYTREQINEALLQENPLELVPVTDENGHGTEMAAAAAGSELEDGLGFVGAAPDADLVIVKLKQAKEFLREFYMVPDGVPAYGLNDIMLAVKYINSFAVPYEKPAVICLGLGRSFGGHQGLTVLEQYLSGVSNDTNRIVVAAGGNEGNTAHHFFREVPAAQTEGNSRGLTASQSGTHTVEAELRVGENVPGFLMEIWGNVPGYFSVSIQSPSGEQTPLQSSRLRGSWGYDFVYGGTRVELDFQVNDQVTGSEVAVVRFENPTGGIWTIRLVQEDGGQGSYHIWLPIRQFVDGEVQFLRPDPEDTLTAPSYASAVLTVTTYDSRNDSFYINSGQGFGLGGRTKPELAAPGVDISTATGILRGRTLVGNVTGSSMAAAITAGACAQLMQWAVTDGNYREISGVGIKSYLVRGADRSAAYSYPSPQWGFGRLNLEGTFDWIAGTE